MQPTTPDRPASKSPRAAIDHRHYFEVFPAIRLIVERDATGVTVCMDANRQARSRFNLDTEPRATAIPLASFLSATQADHLSAIVDRALATNAVSRQELPMTTADGTPATATVVVTPLDGRHPCETGVVGGRADIMLTEPLGSSAATQVFEAWRASAWTSTDTYSSFSHDLACRALDVSKIGFCVSDSSGTILDVNPAFTELLGWTAEDLVGRHFFGFMPEPDRPWLMERYTQFLEKPDGDSEELTLCHKDGELVHILMVCNHLYGPDGTRYVVITVTDISAQKRMEQILRETRTQAEEISRAKSRFLAHMGHELRTPLNAIIGFAEVIRDQTMGPDRTDTYRSYADDIAFSAEHLLKTLNEIFHMASFEGGVDALDEATVRLDELFAEVERTTAERRRIPRLRIDAEIPSDIPMIKGDTALLAQALANVVSNVVTAGPEPGTAGDNGPDTLIGRESSERVMNVNVCVDVSAEAGLTVAIEDHGDPLSATEIRQALTALSDVPATRSLPGGRSSLMLSLAQTIANLHDGDLTIQPGETHRGNRMIFTLPPSRVVSTASPGAGVRPLTLTQASKSRPSAR